MGTFMAKFLPLLILFLFWEAWALSSEIRYQGGQVQGQVRSLGNVPQPVDLPVTRHKEVCGLAKPSEALIVSGGKIQNAVITLETNITEVKGRSPAGRITLEHKDCLFSPHVLAAARGATLVITNVDSILHTAHVTLMEIGWGASQPARLADPHSQASHGGVLFNLGLPLRGHEIRRVLAKAGLYHVMCDIHDWMSAYIWVMDRPFFAVTDAEGRFQMGDVPPGRYKIRAWHETLGVQEKEVEVHQGEKLRMDFEFALSSGSKPMEHHGH